MATRPSMEARQSSDSKRLQSHGRGGAGNVTNDIEQISQHDLVTPHLTSPVYTSGRGGHGNMAHNDRSRPEVARAAQDVEGAPPRLSGTFHAGRGGAGNAGKNSLENSRNLAQEQNGTFAVVPNAAPAKSIEDDASSDEHGNFHDSSAASNNNNADLRGWADKGKDFLFGRNKK